MAYNLDLLTDNKLVLSKKSELPYTKCINRIRIPTKRSVQFKRKKKKWDFDVWETSCTYLLFSAIVAYLMSRGVLSTDFIGFLGITGMLTLFLYKLGEKLPIWNTYIGGGLLMVFFGVAALKQADLIPVKYVKAIMDTEQGTTGLLTVFIIFLILGSILALDRLS